jgi:hypothetical protein
MADVNANAAAAVAQPAPVANAGAAAQPNPRALMVTSLELFGYNRNTCEAIVSSINLRTPKDLLKYADKDFDNLAANLIRKFPTRANAGANAVNIPLTVADDLRAYRKWVQCRSRTDMPTDPQLLTAEGIQDAFDRIQELRLIAEADAVAGEIKEPDRFTDSTNIVEFMRSFNHTCSRKRGISDVPIMWIYRDHDEVTDEILNAEYETRDEYYTATMRLDGTHFKADSAMVYDLLKTATVNTAAWPYVQVFDKKKDGRGAVLDLLDRYNGQATNEARAKKAHRTLAVTKWDGKPTRNYTFETFNAKVTEAYNELENVGEPLASHRQVTMYLDAITDPLLMTVKDVIENDPIKSKDFAAASTHLASVYARRSRPTPQQQREISEADQDSSSGGRRKGGRKGRGKRGPKPFVPDPNRPHIHDGEYTKEDWNRLTDEERKEVKQLHKKRKAKANNAKASDDDEEQADS